MLFFWSFDKQRQRFIGKKLLEFMRLPSDRRAEGRSPNLTNTKTGCSYSFLKITILTTFRLFLPTDSREEPDFSKEN